MEILLGEQSGNGLEDGQEEVKITPGEQRANGLEETGGSEDTPEQKANGLEETGGSEDTKEQEGMGWRMDRRK